MPAQAALVFTTSFDNATVSAAAQAAIGSGLAEYTTLFSDNVNVSLHFINTGNGLASTLSYSFGVDYQAYFNALVADASSAADAAALAHLALDGSGVNNPVNGTPTILQGRAGLAAVGISVDTSGIAGYFDGVIDLNLGIMNLDRISIDPAKYDLKAVLQHEVNEVLGSVSNVGQSDPRPVDLFRYDDAGHRTFTTAGDNAYFSVNGSTLLARYNQVAGPDYGDFYSCNDPDPAHVPQVQDACGTPGAIADLGVEKTLLDVIGWNLAGASPVPEPGSLALAGMALLGLVATRRKA